MVLALFQDVCMTEKARCLRCGRMYTYRRDAVTEKGQQYCPKCSGRK